MNIRHWARLLTVVPILLSLLQPVFSRTIDRSRFFSPADASVASSTSWAQSAYIKASNTGTNDNFGYAVALSGDTLVVGAFLESSSATGVNGNAADNSAPGAGAAYVFVRNNGIWSQQAYLKASNTDADDNFGWAVAISGDTIVVGARDEDSSAAGGQTDDSASNAGAAYVFVRNNGIWSQQAFLKASNAEDGDRFGWSVGISGNTIVVGAYGEDSSVTGVNGDPANNDYLSAGAAYVFVRDGVSWSQQAYLKASNTNPQDFFGFSTDISGDTIVIGASGEDSNATGVNVGQFDNTAPTAGAAYVFTRSAAVWSQEAYIKASNTEQNDFFGWSVSIDGDTLVVGATGEDSSATGANGDQSDNTAPLSGAAYVYFRDATGWHPQAYLKASNTGAEDDFGTSVAISGGYILVGAPSEDSNATGINGDPTSNATSSSGAVYGFVRNGTDWSFQTYLKASNTGSADRFGWAVDVTGSLSAVGARSESSSATGVNGNQSDNSAAISGAAYSFYTMNEIFMPLIFK